MRTRHRTTTLIVPECDNGAKQKAQAVVTSDVRPCRRKSQTSKNRSGKWTKKEILRKQREEDFWDEYDESESSSDESNLEDSSLDESTSEESNLVVDNVRGDNKHEGLGDNGGAQLEGSFKPVWKDNPGSYLRGIQGCGSSATTKREKWRKQEMEKSASGSRSIVEMFSTQNSKNQSRNKNPTKDFAPAPPPPKGKKV